ncbi:MAG UNVERIFIED_CONTAM: hypothetical protein LVR29_05075 [Microcystis novacekii LVE1205-3]
MATGTESWHFSDNNPFSYPIRMPAIESGNFIFTMPLSIVTKDRLYLDCWCEETEGNQDISELHHNWSLRIDRIPNDFLNYPDS